MLLLLSLLLLTSCGAAVSQADRACYERCDSIIQAAVADSVVPGAVLCVVNHGRVAYEKAYGYAEVYPDRRPMSTSTIFDLASLSKSTATAIAVMQLVEQGRVDLQATVGTYLPDFQDTIRVIHLLTHTSGLPPYAPTARLAEQYGSPAPDSLLRWIASCNRSFPPLTRMQYSCLNFITLQHIVERVSGQPLDRYCKEHIYQPLGMSHTTFCPQADLLPLVAPTERMADGSVLRGVVHDPLARVMNGGVSGNAGLFSSARDLAVLSLCLLGGGEYEGHLILRPQTVAQMTSVPAGYEAFGRTLGWDRNSDYSSNQGHLLGPHTYGHTGYTGTSLVIDPDRGLAIILLTHRVHPTDRGSVLNLRAAIADACALLK